MCRLFAQIWISIYFAFAFALPSLTPSLAISTHPIIVVLGFDGFRYDYLDRGLNPVLKKLSEDGVSTDFLMNVYPTKTFTNFFAIATGMYAETHGVLANKVFNEHGQCLRYGHELFHYNEDIIPIWILNEMSGKNRHSGCMMWPGCDFPYQDRMPRHFQKYDSSISWSDRVDTMVNWLVDEENPINLLTTYFEQPDSDCHIYGPYSNQVNEKLKNVDEILQYFLQQVAKKNIQDRINLIVLSDHGMVEIKTNEVINISSTIDSTTYTRCGDSPILQILPQPGYEEQVYQNLTSASDMNRTFKVYKKDEVPEIWHWKNNRRNIGFYAAANPTYTFDDSPNYKGNHGYTTELKNMRAFFAAIGPIFRQHHHVSWLHNIDVYPLIAHVLKLDSPPDHVKPNGTLIDIVNILNVS